MKNANATILHKLLHHALLQIVILVFLISGCSYGNGEANILSDARDANEAENILGEIFIPGVTTATEIENYLGDKGLNCTEKDNAAYDPDFSNSFYDGSIVCWIPAPNAEARSELDGLNSLVVTYVFRTVFLFEGETLSAIRVVLDDRAL